jgi:hypothetical protein
VQPVLDYRSLRPGHAATEAISQIASDLKLGSIYQVRVRQTGEIPMDDDEFGTITKNAGITTSVSIGLVLVILWLALRSPRIIAAVTVTLMFGLAISAAAGLLLVGAFNLISIAFFVLFVGLGVDFAIQFSVRYRSERHDRPDLRDALRSAALKAGSPLALAAVAIAAGFSSFMPTDYIGLSELGEIAGIGMIVAFLSSITLLPAMLTLFNPPGEPQPMGFSWLAPVDRFTARHRIPIVVITLLVVLLATPLLMNLPFDFNPTHLQDPNDAGDHAQPIHPAESRRENQAHSCRGAIDRCFAQSGETRGAADRSAEHRQPEVDRRQIVASCRHQSSPRAGSGAAARRAAIQARRGRSGSAHEGRDRGCGTAALCPSSAATGTRSTKRDTVHHSAGYRQAMDHPGQGNRVK